MRRSPRFVVRVLAASFATVVLVLAAVFTVLILHTRGLVQRSVVDNLEAGQRLLALFERERQHEARCRRRCSPRARRSRRRSTSSSRSWRCRARRRAASRRVATVENEVNRLAGLLQADVVAVVGARRARDCQRGAARARPGVPGSAWRSANRRRRRAFETVVTLGSQTLPHHGRPPAVRRIVDWRSRRRHRPRRALRGAALQRRAHERGGRRRRPRDCEHARDASRAPPSSSARASGLDDAGLLTLGDEDFAYRRLQQIGPTAFYALDSITAASDRVSRDALPKLAAIAFGGVVLCLLASVRLARTVSAPIDQLSRELAAMADAHTPGRLAPAKRTSHEIETLTATFNRLINRWPTRAPRPTRPTSAPSARSRPRSMRATPTPRATRSG